jgi:hypothetical protein
VRVDVPSKILADWHPLRDAALVVALVIGLAALSASAESRLPEAASPLSPPTHVEPPLLEPSPVASYRLNAKLDPVSHQIEAEGTITFTNRSARAVDDVYLHLYLNAFKNTESTFSRSPFYAGRGGKKPDEWGHCQVTALRSGTEDLWIRREYPVPNDETDVRVPLTQPLPPGASLTLELAFTATLPGIVERTGFSRDYHLVAQWFPKLAKLEPDGEWAHFDFHPQSEFYADFGDYDITLEVPEPFVVGATGELQNEELDNGVRRLRYVARGVHDFAWVAWPDFRVREETIAGVRVRILFPRGHEHNAELELRAVRFGLPHFGARYGQYPYATLTVVHPPRHARDSGGMEYPTFITTGGTWFSSAFSRSIELVTLHELAHQWFYGLLASNERRYPFLDEGLASYAEIVASREWFGDGGAMDHLGLRISTEALHRVGSAQVSGAQNVASQAPDFVSFQNLGGLVYSRTATLFATFARTYGEEPTRRALLHYATAQRFRHPVPDALLGSIEKELGPTARSQAALVLLQRGSVDYQLADLESVETPGRRGVFGVDLSENTAPAPGDFSSRVVVTRKGTVSFPVAIAIGYEDGSVERRDWDGVSETVEVLTTSQTRAVWANVDPELRVPLDDNLMNNSATLSPTRSLRVMERLAYVAQLMGRTLGP